MAYFPNPVLNLLCYTSINNSYKSDLLHTISIVFTEYSGLYIDLCCLQSTA